MIQTHPIQKNVLINLIAAFGCLLGSVEGKATTAEVGSISYHFIGVCQPKAQKKSTKGGLLSVSHYLLVI
jgi:hypothetical protein